MPQPTEPLREHPSTYFVQDRTNQEEMERLKVQDKMLTMGMGGVLPELTDPTSLHRVLDIGCGTGGWLIETAKTYPTIEKLVGGDISGAMMAYARAQAEAEQLEERVEFHTMDALRMLEFPNAFFDLVNQRLGASWIRTWEWAKILSEYQRVARPDGVIRITEGDWVFESNSPALTTLNRLGIETFYRSGRLFAAGKGGITGELVRLMTLHGIQDVQTQVYTLVYQGGTVECQYFCEDILHFFRVGMPFFQKWIRVPDDFEETYQQALQDMQQPDFIATVTFLTAWGKSSPKKNHSFRMV